ncbi:hypothetical protein [Pseudonocardia acidicola]|uniref:Lipoprotein LpqN n=1 Tax=Pseudonocardia acidicola TaxID=2724939 RepID=A0ABX1S861_9PSEU|nr:hypothetical protein [Pseudonocardia acidicola]NMH97749.1 hypothetical protein [Pseudonocardia acidicola]
MTFRRRTAVLACCAVALLAGCGGRPAGPPAATGAGASTSAPNPNAPEVNAAGDIPDTQVFVPYPAPDGSSAVSVPQGWARASDGTAVVFTDKFNSVRIESLPRGSAPTVASATADEVPAIQRSTAGFAPGDVSTVSRKAGQAVLITYTGASAPDPVTGKSVTEAVERYEFWRGGTEVVLTLSGPKGADNVDPWRTVTDSFRWSR